MLLRHSSQKVSALQAGFLSVAILSASNGLGHSRALMGIC